MLHHPGRFLAILLIPATLLLNAACSADTEITLDAIVASVDGKPITLQDVNRHLSPPRNLTVREASMDFEARRVLDALIMEQLIEAEASSKKIRVTDDEITNYMDEVARRNNMDRPTFYAALQRQGLSLDQYRRQVRMEILRSKLSGWVMQNAPGVTTKEVEAYIEEHSELAAPGSKVKLRQIFIKNEGRSPEEITERITAITGRLSNGESFAVIAKSLSEGPEAADGGDLGVVPEKELNPQLFDAIFALKDGETSQPQEFPDGVRIVLLERRYVEQEEDDAALKQDIKKQIERQKSETLVQNFFATEIFKNHSVDKKI